MDVSRMRDIFAPHLAQISERIFLNNELGIVHGDPRVFRLVMRQKPPFVINDHRLGIIARGEAVINLNLQDRHFTAGTLVYLGPGSLIAPVRFSADLAIYGVGLFADFPMPFADGALPSAFNGQARDFQLAVGEGDLHVARSIVDTLWQVVRDGDYHRATASALVAALMHHYDHLYRRQAARQGVGGSREQTLFDRFIRLVGQYCKEQHQLDFYAERLCLTKRYLGTVVRQARGITAKQWIDQALLAYAKALLLHSDKTVAQVADELHFPNPAFFCKFFRRLTGTTPHRYRQGSLTPDPSPGGGE